MSLITFPDNMIEYSMFFWTLSHYIYFWIYSLLHSKSYFAQTKKLFKYLQSKSQFLLKSWNVISIRQPMNSSFYFYMFLPHIVQPKDYDRTLKHWFYCTHTNQFQTPFLVISLPQLFIISDSIFFYSIFLNLSSSQSIKKISKHST